MSTISQKLPAMTLTVSSKKNHPDQKSPSSITSTAIKHFPKGPDDLSNYYSSSKTRERYIITVLPKATPPHRLY